MAIPAKIRINVRAPFPAQVNGAAFIGVSKANGVWTLEPDYTLLAEAPAVTATQIAAVYDTASGVWSYIPSTMLIGGISTLHELSDVNVSEGPAIDGYSLTWNNATSKWVASLVSGGGGGGTTLQGLTDVQVTAGPAINGYSLTWSQSTGKWIAVAPVVPGSTTLHGLTDVNVSEGPGIDGFSLTWNNATAKWVATLATGGSTTLHGLSDVNVTEGPAIDGFLLTWNNATSKWIAAAAAITSAAMAAWFATLQTSPTSPTVLPSGSPYNNGNTIGFAP